MTESMTLLSELLQAEHMVRHDPEFAAGLRALGFFNSGPIWGFDRVEFSGPFYEPAPEGALALIVPSYRPLPDEGLQDLVACRATDGRTATRRGHATVLGEEWLDFAVASRSRALLHANPLRWMMAARRGVVILDWPSVPFLFDFVPEVLCPDRAFARRVWAATRCMEQPPHIRHVHKRRLRHAA